MEFYNLKLSKNILRLFKDTCYDFLLHIIYCKYVFKIYFTINIYDEKIYIVFKYFKQIYIYVYGFFITVGIP